MMGGNGRYSKDQVRYVETSPRPNQICAACKFFVNPDQCQLVYGMINQRGYCSQFQPSGAAYPSRGRRLDPKKSAIYPRTGVRKARPGELVETVYPYTPPSISNQPYLYQRGDRIQLPDGREGVVERNLHDNRFGPVIIASDENGFQHQIRQVAIHPPKQDMLALKLATRAFELQHIVARDRRGTVVLQGLDGLQIPYAGVVAQGMQIAKQGPVQVLGRETTERLWNQLGQLERRVKISKELGIGGLNGSEVSWSDVTKAWSLWPKLQAKFKQLDEGYKAGQGTSQQRSRWTQQIKPKYEWLLSGIGTLEATVNAGKASWDLIKSGATAVWEGTTEAASGVWNEISSWFAGPGLGVGPIAVAVIVIGIIWLWNVLFSWKWEGQQQQEEVPNGYEYDPETGMYFPVGWEFDPSTGDYYDPNDPDQRTEGVPRDGDCRCEPCYYAEEGESNWWFGDFGDVSIGRSDGWRNAYNGMDGAGGVGYVQKQRWWVTPGFDIPGFNEDWEKAAGNLLNGLIMAAIVVVGIQILPHILGSMAAVLRVFSPRGY